MSETITYRGHMASVRFDARDGILVGRLLGVPDVIGFHGDNGEEIKAAFHEVVDDYIEEHGEPTPAKSYSGNIMVRVKPEVHANVAMAAQVAGKSLNAWTEATLEEAARKVVGEAVCV